MRILFICGCLEFGRDGVGDYTRKLSAELIKQGHSVAITALYDGFTEVYLQTTQQSGDIAVPVFRTPKAYSETERFKRLELVINEFNPQWLSLQFVPFAFNPKGIPIKLGSNLKRVSGMCKWHIMFHEIWQGESRTDNYKQRTIGVVQKIAITQISKTIKVQSYSTSNDYYREALLKKRIPAVKIPVFSNLPIGKPVGKHLIDKLPETVLKNRDQYIIGVFFGAIHYSDQLFNGLNRLSDKASKSGKKLVITHVGKAHELSGLSIFLDGKYLNVFFGEQDEQNIADYFCNADVGLSTNPKILFEKSGSIAAMLNNNLPVILLRESFENDTRNISFIKEINEVENVNDFLQQKKSFGKNYGVSFAADKYAEIMNLKS